MESDGLHGKPARIVCVKCADPNLLKTPADKEAASALQDWRTPDGHDASEIINEIACRVGFAKRYSFAITKEQVLSPSHDDTGYDVAAGAP